MVLRTTCTSLLYHVTSSLQHRRHTSTVLYNHWMHIGTGWMLCKPICCQTSWSRPPHLLKGDTRCTHSLMSLSDSPRDLMICHWKRRLPVLAATLLWTCSCKEERQRGTEERVTAHSCSSLTPLGNIHKYAIGHSTVPHGTLTGLYRQYMALTGGCIGNTWH